MAVLRRLVTDAASEDISVPLTAGVERLAYEMGADLVGVASADAFDAAPAGHRPGNLLRDARSVVVMAVHMLDGAFELAPSREYSVTFQVACQELNRIAYHVARYLQGEGHRALQVPASPPYDLEHNMGDLSHRHAGQLAGIGVFGKNSLLLSPDYGPRIRLTSVITDAGLEPSVPLDVDLCEDCNICLRGCPVDALEGPGVVNKTVCDANHVSVGERLQLADSEQICGVCIRVCPVGLPDAEPGRGSGS